MKGRSLRPTNDLALYGILPTPHTEARRAEAPGVAIPRPVGSARRVMRWLLSLVAWVPVLLSGCCVPRAGSELQRRGDEIVACGRLFHTGTPVVLWTDPGGYDAYRVERRFSPWEAADWETSEKEVAALETPNRFGLRRQGLTDDEIAKVRGGGWDLDLLRRQVDQFVLHYDACGTSRRCFEVLHDLRGLSVHFLLDVDGTIYQTLDLKERAWHATTSNTRSIGIEIAQIGAVSLNRTNALGPWYAADAKGPFLQFPEALGPTGIHTPDFVGRPARPELVVGEIQGRTLAQYDFTPEQYAALRRLTAALCRIFPRIRRDYPRDAEGNLVRSKLSAEALEGYSGLLGHYHIQANKVDPGPAFQWERITHRFLPMSDRR